MPLAAVYLKEASELNIGPANVALVGIEMEAREDELVTWQQVDSCAEYIVNEALHWGWSFPYRMWNHSNIAIPYGRRSDPINFDIGALMGRLYVRSLGAHIPGM